MVRAAGALLESHFADESANPGSSALFRVPLNYGTNIGSNPYAYPPLKPNPDGSTPLGADGWYPDFSRAASAGSGATSTRT